MNRSTRQSLITEQMPSSGVRMAGMALRMKPSDIDRMVSNPSEITKRLRYQEANPST